MSAAKFNAAELPEWRQNPRNEWTFRNMDQVLKTSTIKASETSPSPLGQGSLDLDAIKIATPLGELDWSTFLSKTYTDAVLVLHKGNILVEEYFHGNERASRHLVMSITKSVVGVVAGILQSQGRLDPDAPVTKYVPEMAGSGCYAECTLRNLLDMRSGCTVMDAGNAEYSAANGWSPSESDGKTTLFEYIETLKDVPGNEPGDAWDYNSINTDLLSWCLTRITGKPLNELISDLVWQPMGAETDALLTVDVAGNGRAAGGLCASLRDIGRFGRLVALKGQGIVPSDWVEDMLHGGDVEAFAKGAWAALSPGGAYRSYWTCNAQHGLCVGLGIHGQVLLSDVKNDIVMVRFASEPASFDVGLLASTMQAFRKIQQLIVG